MTINITDVDETPVVTVLIRDNTEKTYEKKPQVTRWTFFSLRTRRTLELTWSLSGADGDKFDINKTGTSGILTFEASTRLRGAGGRQQEQRI